MTDDEYAIAKSKNWHSAEEAAEKMIERYEHRQCMVCGADSGDDTILPPGWSYAVQGKSEPDPGSVIAFFCERCAPSLNFHESRNYASHLN